MALVQQGIMILVASKQLTYCLTITLVMPFSLGRSWEGMEMTLEIRVEVSSTG